MSTIRPVDDTLHALIQVDYYNIIIGKINSKCAEMDKYITNLKNDIRAVKRFRQAMISDRERGYDVGSALQTLGFQRDSLEIDLNFFVHMKEVYTKKLYGNLYEYCSGVADLALTIEEVPAGQTREGLRKHKLRNLAPYPPPMVPNPRASISEDEPETIMDPTVVYDMKQVFALMLRTAGNLRELADDIGTFSSRIAIAQAYQERGFNVGNLVMNLEGQHQKLCFEFKSYVRQLSTFLEKNITFWDRCLERIRLISSEIVTEREQDNEENGVEEGAVEGEESEENKE